MASIFPLRLIYAPSLIIFKWLCHGMGYQATPMAAFYVLRGSMFLLSFVLEDWALHELLPDQQERGSALLLVASSYVTWTFQMHTFSNSIETIIVLWCLVLMRRMQHDPEHTQVTLCIVLAFLGVLGVFSRITFPAFLIVAGVQLLPHLWAKPLRIPILLGVAASTTVIAVALDTEYYHGHQLRFRQLFSTAVFTPLNNLTYNLDASNLAQHGVHPYWQHFIANLPQLLGPLFPLVFASGRRTTLFWSGIAGTALLSCFKHQEARFLLPAVPLLLSSIQLPKRFAKIWIATWIGFNVLAAILFGRYHQAGVVPVQAWLAQQENVSEVFWWKTYSPPRWILGEANNHLNTTDLMGMDGDEMFKLTRQKAECRSHKRNLLVAPSSATYLDQYKPRSGLVTYPESAVPLDLLYHYSRHIGLDDLDWGADGVWGTLYKVIGRRGLDVWDISLRC
ncbi:alpha 1,2 mannosyltransferase [Recurvomyces mirabilis]|nr:alpha 1,2 mannosyltransferase [Recurvomyces mirabilis]